MGYTIRYFTTSPLGSLIPVQAQMIQAEFEVHPAGTNQLDIFYHPDRGPLTVDLTDSTQATTQREIAQFIEAVTERGGPERDTVLSVLVQTQALVAIGVPDGLQEVNADALPIVLEIIANLGDGLFHVQGEGFYAGNNLIFEL